ncbi:MAG: aromatic ring-hydroxylating dioxygenase subunit alpha, partial [Nocardioides sp.]|nr:aromatic ring-hydroxylating dioxygenase subunit alpha [Nocardioides sp.]
MTTTVPHPRRLPTDVPTTTAAAEPPEALRQQLHHRAHGRPLPGHFYTDPDVYAADLDLVFGQQWFLACTEAEVREPGDFVTIDIGHRSIIVIRDDDERINAFHNVCRHRGARVLTEPSGFVGNLRCRYHSWTYSPDGRLLHAPGLPEGTDPACLGLRQVAVRAVDGLVFLCLAVDAPADIDDFAARASDYLAPHGLADAKVAAQVDLVEEANWKLVMENNRECYHCDGHPELSCSFFPTYGLEADQVPERLRPAHERFLAAEADLKWRCDELGLPHATIEDLVAPRLAHRIAREALDGAGESFSLDGRALVTRPLADLGERRLGRLSFHTQPNAWVHVMSDHAVAFTALPIAPDRTLVRTTWLVHADAQEGVDYDLDQLTHVWRETNKQDSAFVALTQAGVSDPAYIPGPYTTSEYQVDDFLSWYVARMLEGLGTDPWA